MVSSIFNMSRFDLCVFPSQKGVFSGDIIILDEDGQFLTGNKLFEKSNLIGYEYFLEEINIESKAKFILVVEKETIFFNLINSEKYTQIFSNSIIVTGKGYPDYITKFFIKRVASLLNIPIIYFGDLDVYGLDIFLNYTFGSKGSSRENEFITINNMYWLGMNFDNLTDISNLVDIEDSLLPLEDTDRKKMESLLNEKEYFHIEGNYISKKLF